MVFGLAAILGHILQDGMMDLVWTERLSVGNAMIDSEHKVLLGMINEAECAIRARDSVALPQAFKRLEDCVRAHFANEETIARAINFPFTHNKLEHQYVQKELQFMKEELMAKSGMWSESAAEHYSYFLSEWMVEHILKEDILMKPMLQTYPYDFKPPELGK